ncbi:MAG: hypothetical protein FJ304_10545 [Planctomycetes bacterium]|nr:hypothetical protein [Planctomycetota bacterium]
MFRLLALSLCAAVGAAPVARAADDDAKAILAKAIKAHGGEDVLSKNKAAITKNKGKINLPGAGEIEFTQETSYMIPDKFKDVMELKIGDKSITVLTIVNGDKITLEVDGKEMKAPDEAKTALKEAGHVLEVARLVPLKDKKYELSIIGEDKVEGKKVVGVRVTAKGQKDMSIFFDKETGLMAKLEFRGSEPGTGKEVTEERIVTEYAKGKNGVPQPKKVIVKHDGKQFLEAEVLEVTSYEKLDDSVFKK